MPFFKDALDQLNCHKTLRMPDLHAPRWVDYCKGKAAEGGQGERQQARKPLLGKQFLSLECASEICAIIKFRTPAPKGVTF